MFRSLLKSNLTRSVLSSKVGVPAAIRPAVAFNFQRPSNSIRFYSAFPELTREIAKERIYELLEDYEKIQPGKEITDQSSFVQDLGLDSLDVVEVVMELEHEFNIQIPDHEADSLKTVGQTIDYILAQPDAC